ncbi:hypothetical protein H311_02309 [Anncaliia algerae PRA109]|nr:hypothetical protein H311_02309 [Anncaliia algerae PRA109]
MNISPIIRQHLEDLGMISCVVNTTLLIKGPEYIGNRWNPIKMNKN